MPIKNLKLFSEIIIFALVAIFVAIISYNLGSVKSLNNEIDKAFQLSEQSFPEAKVPQIFTIELPRQQNSTNLVLDDYQKYKQHLNDIVSASDPKEALKQLQSDLDSVKTVQQNCHSYTHLIGNFALSKYDFDLEKAISYNLDMCGGGYLHGIIEEYLEKYPEKSQKLYLICKNPKDGGCFHALGHGFMLKNEFDTNKSVLDCEALNTPKQQQWCGEGIFMENFDSTNVSDSEKPFLKATDPFYPCSSYRAPYQDDCYYYSGRFIYRLKKEPYSALQVCLGLNQKLASTCVRGMAAGIIRDNLKNPENMEKICQSVPLQIRSCLKGAANYHIFMFDSKDKTQTQMCDKFLDLKVKKTCTEMVQESTINFE